MARMTDELTGDGLSARPAPNRRSESATAAAVGPGRDRLAGAGRTLLWLVPMTVMIWVYAEREQTQKFTASSVSVHLSTSVADRFVEAAGPSQTPTVTLKLSGPQGGVQAVAQDLAKHGLPIDLGARWVPGRDRQVIVTDAIGNLPLFRSAGVTVEESSPPDLRVNVDVVEDRPAEVEVDQRVRNLDGPGTFEPATVTVHGPSRQLDELAAFEKRTDGKLRVTADLSKFAEQLRLPGDRTLDMVPLTLPTAEPQVTVKPSTVTARLQIRAADESFTIDAVPIYIRAAPATLQQYDVTLDMTTITPVHVTGPPAAIADIRNKVVRVAADLDVAPGDEDRPRPVDYSGHLPPGVTVSPEDLAKRFTFKLTRREPAGG